MNRQELEKLIDKIDCTWSSEQWCECWSKLICSDRAKEFIFDTIIPEVLNSLFYDEKIEKMFYNVDKNFYDWYLEKIKDIEKQAKELYNINL
jgi:hypothetical protein